MQRRRKHDDAEIMEKAMPVRQPKAMPVRQPMEKAMPVLRPRDIGAPPANTTWPWRRST